MPQVALQRPRIGSSVCQNIAGGMSEYVGMDLKRNLGGDTGAIDELLQARYGERRSALADEYKR